MLHPVLLLGMIACPTDLSAEVEMLGVRGDHASAFERVLANKELLEIRHPALARLWGDKFLFPYGLDNGAKLNARKIPVSAGPYSDGRPVTFLLLPKPLADQAGYKRSIRGVSIESLSHDPEAKRLTAQVLLCAEGPTRASGMLSFSCGRESYQRILFLYRALRLRIRMSLRVRAVEGNPDVNGIFLVLAVSEPKATVLDLSAPIVAQAQEVRFVSDRQTDPLQVPGGARIDLGAGGGLEVETTETIPGTAVESRESPVEAKPGKVIRFVFGAHQLDGLPFSEGLQPWRRGWFLKDGWPGHPATVIAVCSHMKLPASTGTAFPKPLPPGLYKVALRTTYFRSRFFDSILRVRMADAEAETCYWFRGFSDSAGPSDWVLVPALRTTRPADRITITALQIGGGDRSQAPPYFRRWVAFDRFFITNVMADVNGDRLAKSLKEQEETIDFSVQEK